MAVVACGLAAGRMIISEAFATLSRGHCIANQRVLLVSRGMSRHFQFNLKRLLLAVVVAAIFAAAMRGSWLAIVLIYWGAAFWWAVSGDEETADWD